MSAPAPRGVCDDAGSLRGIRQNGGMSTSIRYGFLLRGLMHTMSVSGRRRVTTASRQGSQRRSTLGRRQNKLQRRDPWVDRCEPWGNKQEYNADVVPDSVCILVFPNPLPSRAAAIFQRKPIPSSTHWESNRGTLFSFSPTKPPRLTKETRIKV